MTGPAPAGTHGAAPALGRRLHHALAVVGGLGLVATVAGTFLPWVRSGEVSRNSYASAGLLQRLLEVHGAAATALNAWPFLGLACAAIVAGFAFGLRRSAAVGALVVGAAAVLVAFFVLRTGGSGPIGHASSGPLVTILGGGISALAATLFLASGRRLRTPWRSTP